MPWRACSRPLRAKSSWRKRTSSRTPSGCFRPRHRAGAFLIPESSKTGIASALVLSYAQSLSLHNRKDGFGHAHQSLVGKRRLSGVSGHRVAPGGQHAVVHGHDLYRPHLPGPLFLWMPWPHPSRQTWPRSCSCPFSSGWWSTWACSCPSTPGPHGTSEWALPCGRDSGSACPPG